MTIGYGHVIRAGEMFDEITPDEADDLLVADLGDAERAVSRLVKVPLNQNQFDALVSWTFNLGAGNLEKSTLLKKLNSGDYGAAKAEFAKWIYAAGKAVGGLARRRDAEAKLFGG